MNKRFQDANLKLSYFNNKVLVVCPICNKKATVNQQGEDGSVLSCFECYYTSSKCLSDADRKYITGSLITYVQDDFWQI